MTSRPAESPGRLRALVRAPLLHFLVLGCLLFVLRAVALAPEPTYRIEVSAADVSNLEAGWRQQTGRDPDDRERAALIRSEVDDRLLLEEAFARGWHRNDAIALRRLVQNQRFLTPDDPASDGELLERAFDQGMDRSDLVVRRRLLERMRLALFAAARAPAPSRDELEAFLAADPARFERPARTRLSHVFLSRDRRQDALAADAAALGRRIRAEALSPEQAVALSDPFLVSADFPLWPESRIARQLGASFAASAMQVPVGEWAGPIASAYGQHWVFVHEREPVRRPPLDDVIGDVRAELLRERERRALREHLAALRARAEIVVPAPER